ncbi:hypothetical protein QYE76_008665 [Lolium multiflorum]|uniref:Uncharacterized protein n=1 Tax=Lolium multiflorum TaxID=4521 RepID=A0AAD8X074_LOLMU|nr:hypothetical protein QYE76_008665 [Lolium multiflorum]
MRYISAYNVTYLPLAPPILVAMVVHPRQLPQVEIGYGLTESTGIGASTDSAEERRRHEAACCRPAPRPRSSTRTSFDARSSRMVRWRRRHPPGRHARRRKVFPWRTSHIRHRCTRRCIRRRCCIAAAYCRLRHGAANGGAQGMCGREDSWCQKPCREAFASVLLMGPTIHELCKIEGNSLK